MARRFVTAGGRRFPLKTEAERRASRARKMAGSSRRAGGRISIPRVPRPGIPAVYRRPLASRGSIGRRSTSLGFLLALIVGLDLLRRFPAGWRVEDGWPIPNMRGLVAGYLGAIVVFGVAAALAPGFTTVVVVGIVALQLIRAAPAIGAWTRDIGARIGPIATGQPSTQPTGQPPRPSGLAPI